MYKRILNLSDLLKKKSHFLFGARSTGKSTLIEADLTDVILIDLLHAATYQRLLKNPSDLEEIVLAKPNKVVVIDEIQKLPVLLDEVHRLIQKT